MLSNLAILGVSLLSVLGQAAPSTLFPDPDAGSHGFKVAVSHFPLTDTARKDPYKTDQDRSIMASIFMPVARSACQKDCQINYMPEQTSRIADQQFLLNAPSSVFNKLGYNVCCGSTTSIDAGALPVVLLEPHTDTSRLMYGNLARYISGNGVVVIMLDHPGETSIVEFIDSSANNAPPSFPIRYNSGTVPLSNFSPLTAWNATVQKALDTRQDDISFALSELTSLSVLRAHFPSLTFSTPLNTSFIGVVGHGFGGSTATSLSLEDSPSFHSSTNLAVRFSINLSGTPPQLTCPADSVSPIYFLGRGDYKRQDDIFWPTTWRFLTGPATELDLAASGIMDFTDLPIARELAHNEGKMPGVIARGLGGESAWPNHAVVCLAEAIVIKEIFGDGHALSACIRNEQMGVVPYLGDVV